MTKHRILFITAITMFSLQYLSASSIEIRKQMSDAIKGSDARRVRSLLDEHGDEGQIFAADDEENTLLHEACKMLKGAHNDKDSILEIVEQLLTICNYDFKKYDVNAQNRNGNTPFHYVNKGALCPESRVVEWFFQKGANPDIPNEKDNTPFHYLLQEKAREGGYSSAVIKLFLGNGANPNLQNNNGYTPFHYICQQDDFTLIRLFLDGNADPNTQTKAGQKANPNKKNKEGDTPFHYLTQGIYRPDFIELFLKHDAREDIRNNEGKTPYSIGLEKADNKEKFRELHNKNRDWHHIKDHLNWQEYKKDLPDFIKKRFRYYALDEPTGDFINNDQNIITMVTIHDINDQENPGYYDTENVQFKGIMQFAEHYIKTYNLKEEEWNRLKAEKAKKAMNKAQKAKEKVEKAEKKASEVQIKKKKAEKAKKRAEEAANYTPKKLKTLHLTSFSWRNNMVSSAEKLSKYLDEVYPNSTLIFLAHGFGSDVANLTSHRVGYLKVNEAIREGNKKIRADQKKLHKGRIRLLLYFLPSCRNVIPAEKKSSFINPLGMVYDAVNDTIATKATNYNLMLAFHSPLDEQVKPDTLDHSVKAVGRVTMGIGGLITYAAIENLRSEGVSTPTLLMGGVGGLTLYYALWSSHNKMQTISDLSRHRYKNIIPKNGTNGDSFIIEGPKVHLKTMIDNEYIGHAIPAELLKNIPNIFKMLKTQYFTELARSRSFCININTRQNVHTLLKYLKENEDKVCVVKEDDNGQNTNVEYIFNDNGPEGKIKKGSIKNKFKFWDNRQDNCKVQCWFDRECKPFGTEENLYFYWARTKKKAGTDERDQLVTQAKRTQMSHKRLYDEYKKIVNPKQ